jgi:hypothetical protein
MTARSLMPLLTSSKSGQVERSRDHVLTGMERYVPCRGEIRGGYPMRAIRTRQFHYIRNFEPDRWAAGDWKSQARSRSRTSSLLRTPMSVWPTSTPGRPRHT